MRHVVKFPTQLTGHSSWLQLRCKFVSPVQSVPPCCASVLVRVWVPLPHGSEHAPQSDKLQSTGSGQSLVFVEFVPTLDFCSPNFRDSRFSMSEAILAPLVLCPLAFKPISNKLRGAQNSTNTSDRRLSNLLRDPLCIHTESRILLLPDLCCRVSRIPRYTSRNFPRNSPGMQVRCKNEKGWCPLCNQRRRVVPESWFASGCRHRTARSTYPSLTCCS